MSREMKRAGASRPFSSVNSLYAQLKSCSRNGVERMRLPVAYQIALAQLVNYLMDGWHRDHGMAAGPMMPVVNSLHEQNEIDVFAIAAYVATLRDGAKPIDEAAVKTAALKLEWGSAESPPVPKELSEGARVFQARCAQCHGSGGATMPLALQTSVNAPDASSVAQVIWTGIKPPQGALGRSMPSFGPQMSESEMVALVKFVRGRYSKDGAWSGVELAVKDARRGG